MTAIEKQEDLARYLNQLSQIGIHFDDCSKKIQDIYRQKAGWILDHLAELAAEKPASPFVPRSFEDEAERNHLRKCAECKEKQWELK